MGDSLKKVYAFSAKGIRLFLADGFRISTLEMTNTGISATLIKG